MPRRVEVGGFAKLRVTDGIVTERMWFEVIRKLGKGRFLGRLDNKPVLLVGIRYNDRVAFDEREAISTISKRSRVS